MTEQSEVQDAVRDVLTVYSRALAPVGDLASTEYLNGTKTTYAVGDALRELGMVSDPEREVATVDQQERALVLALIAAGLPAATVARRCGYAPATVARWLAEESA
ncbi:helix-turn-helix domain-containing protein [Mycobacterium sp. D16Q16]|uniref:helix-turn-helix domain-containing protein n=1 Tax=Mycobacterium sp. D16Q16 TaxID=1855659 RepID=UPI0009932243|nr:helix-turn-helix domain-containing protein [Mycobacterium sp. D16Q16]